MHLQGPYSLRPCSSRPYWISLFRENYQCVRWGHFRAAGAAVVMPLPDNERRPRIVYRWLPNSVKKNNGSTTHSLLSLRTKVILYKSCSPVKMGWEVPLEKCLLFLKGFVTLNVINRCIDPPATNCVISCEICPFKPRSFHRVFWSGFRAAGIAEGSNLVFSLDDVANIRHCV